MSDDKPSEAEEILSEFQGKNEDKEKTQAPAESEASPEPESSVPPPEPEPTPSEPEKQQQSQEPPKEQSQGTEKESTDRVRNVIFVGTKPIMTYVTATLTQLSSEPTVTIKARGKRITQAVDVSQMIVKRMDSVGYKVSAVRIASDSLTSQDGRQRNVSTIEIDVTKT